MSKRFGRKQKREMRESLLLNEKKFALQNLELRRKVDSLERQNRATHNQLCKFEKEFRNMLPEPKVTAGYITDINDSEKILSIEMQAFRFRFMHTSLNEQNIDFIAHEFAKETHKRLVVELMKLPINQPKWW